MFERSMSQSTTPVRSFLKDNPKWIGVLFWMTVLLMEAGAAMGSGGSATAGP